MKNGMSWLLVSVALWSVNAALAATEYQKAHPERARDSTISIPQTASISCSVAEEYFGPLRKIISDGSIWPGMPWSELAFVLQGRKLGTYYTFGFTSQDAQASKLLFKSCSPNQDVLKFSGSTSLMPRAISGDMAVHSNHPRNWADWPDAYRAQIPVGHALAESSGRAYWGFRIPLTNGIEPPKREHDVSLVVVLATHEGFHSLQFRHFKNIFLGNDVDEVLSRCSKTPRWKETLSAEVVDWNEHSFGSLKRERTPQALRVFARDLLNRRDHAKAADLKSRKCWDVYEQLERIEGTADYVQYRALESAGMKTYPSDWHLSPFNSQQIGYSTSYVTGGGIAGLLHRLDPAGGWKMKVQDGLTLSEALRAYAR